MMCALAQLVGVVPPGHEHRMEIQRALAMGLTTRNTELATRGVMTRDHALEALLLVRQTFAADAAFLSDTKSDAALRALARFASAEAQRGKLPLSPGAWGLFLEFIANNLNP